MRTVLEVRDVSIHFGGVAALSRIRFRLKEGMLHCLIGPNGAGKSTFFKCLTGMLTPHEGQIILRGEDCRGFKSHQIAQRGVGVKTQIPNVMNGLSVYENIWLSARRRFMKSEANRMAAQMLERFMLGDIATQTLNVLAHGKRQLVEFAMVLAQKPWLILLDEPAAGMSADEVALIAEVIREINQVATLIVVEHDMRFIQMIAERVTVLHQGKVLLEGDVDFVLNDQTVRDVYLGRAV